MSAILGFLLLVIVLILVIGFSVINGIFRLLFGFGKKQHYYSGKTGGSHQNTSRNNNTGQSSSTYTEQDSRKKIFDNDEGEYVDFEEIKDESPR